jgi:hypothetical protein
MSSLIRQDVVPMVAGYVLLMGALAIGLRLSWRTARDAAATQDGTAGQQPAGVPGAAGGQRELEADRGVRPGRRSIAARVRPGWPRLAARVLGTVVPGYLLLMAVIIIYYYGISPSEGNFVPSAFSGCGMLIGIAALVFAALSWLSNRTGWRF